MLTDDPRVRRSNGKTAQFRSGEVLDLARDVFWRPLPAGDVNQLAMFGNQSGHRVAAAEPGISCQAPGRGHPQQRELDRVADTSTANLIGCLAEKSVLVF